MCLCVLFVLCCVMMNVLLVCEFCVCVLLFNCVLFVNCCVMLYGLLSCCLQDF